MKDETKDKRYLIVDSDGMSIPRNMDVTWECCYTCRFWCEGQCHKNPPYLIEEIYGKWPETEEHQWCGSYQRYDYAE